MIYFQNFRASSGALSLGFLLCLNACSPGTFGGKDKDEQLAKQSGYRQIDKSCSNMSLSESELKPNELRTLLTCMNSGGGLEPAASLILKLKDSELKTLLDVFNTHVFSNRARMYEIDATYRQLDTQGILAPAFASAGRLLENSELITQAINLLEKAYRTDPHLALGGLQKFSDRLGPDRVQSTIDEALSLSGSPVFKALQEHLRGDSPAHRDLESLSERAIVSAAAVRNELEKDLFLETIRHFIDGRLPRVQEDILGKTPAQMQSKIGQVSPIFDRLLMDDAQVWSGLADFVQSTKTSLFCAGGAMQIPDLTRFALDEIYRARSEDIASYLQRDKPLQFSSFNAICPLPAGFSANYHWLDGLAESPAIVAGHQLLLSLRDQGLESFMLNLFTPQGTMGMGGLRRIFPILSELSDRHAVADLLLLLTSTRTEDRAELTDSLRFFLEPDARMSGRSLYDVFQISLAHTHPIELARLLRSFKPLIDQNDAVVFPALLSLRGIVRSNDVHPGLDFIRETLQQAPAHQDFLEILFKLAAMPEFKKSIEMVADMSKDGRLQDILDVVNSLFRRYSSLGRTHEITPARIPEFAPKLAHHLTAKDLVPLTAALSPLGPQDPCRLLNSAVPFLNSSYPGYEVNLTRFLNCLGRGAGEAELQTGLEYLRNQRMPDGRNAFAFHLDLISRAPFAKAQTQDFFSRLFRSQAQGEVAQTLRAIPYLVDGREGSAPVLRPFLNLAEPVLASARLELRRILDYGSVLFKHPSLSPALEYGKSLRVEGLDPVADPALNQDAGLRAQYHGLVQYRECMDDPAAIENRVSEIVDDYLHASNNWELVAGKTRRSWTQSEFQAGIQPILGKFSDPVHQGPALDGLLSVVRSFKRDELGTWLNDRSRDEKPILYFYPDEDKPRIRMVNSLDRLELILFNADFVYADFLIPGNHGFRYLARIAEAWGDEPRAVWPAEVQAKYPVSSDRSPPTLSQVYREMKNELDKFGRLLGYPKVQQCRPDGMPDDGVRLPSRGLNLPEWLAPSGLRDIKARLFNLDQTLSVLEENLPGSSHPHAGGMRVLRTLFWELYQSSPAEWRNASAEERNNLWIITRLVRMGFIREIGKTLRIEPMTEARRDFFRGFVAGATSSEVKPLLNTLLVEHPDQKLLLAGIDQVFDRLAGSPDQQARTQQLAFYLIAHLGTPRFGLAAPGLAALEPVLKQNYTYLVNHADLIGQVFEAQDLTAWLRALYLDQEPSHAPGKQAIANLLRETLSDPRRASDLFAVIRSIDSDAAGHAGWVDFRAAWSAVRETPGWQRQDFDEVGRRLYNFLIEEKSPGTAGAVREYLSTLVKSKSGSQPSDLEQELDLIARDPQRFNQVLQTLSHSADNGDLQFLLDEASRALTPVHRR